MSAADDVLSAARLRARALVENDPSGLSELMHPDLRWTTLRGEVLGRDEYVRGNTDGSLRWVGQTLEEPEGIVVGDTAVLAAVVVDAGERDGQPRTFRLRLTQAWVRTGHTWRCLSGHAGPALDNE